MDAQIKVEVVKAEMIKPSNPTPDHLRSLKLSAIDQITPFYRTLVILFYPNTNISVDKRSQVLKLSLSNTLSKFYPFAGRLKDNLWIECNDAGAELVIARVHSPVSKFLEKPDSGEMLKLLVPPNNETSKEAVFSSPLLLVRASFFDCGALSITFRLSHKIGDGTSVNVFLKSWSATASSILTSHPDSNITPKFASSSFFPPSESMASVFTEPPVFENVKVKRLVFHGHTITALRSRLATPSVPNPSRVEVVFAVLLNALISSGSKSVSKYVVTQHVNVRKLVTQTSSENCVGNLAWIYISESMCRETVGMKEIVVLLRKGLEELKASSETRVQMEGIRALTTEISRLRKQDQPVGIYATSSLCKLRWYESDFGWGNPSLVCLPNLTLKDIVFLLDSKDGSGIDAWLSLSEEDMSAFETTFKLLSFNPIIPSAM